MQDQSTTEPNTRIFWPDKNGIVSFHNINYFENNLTTTLWRAKNNYSRDNSECSNNPSDTRKTLNSIILCNNMIKDTIQDHNGSSVSDPSNLDCNISNVNKNLSIEFPRSTCIKLIFLTPPPLGKWRNC